MSLIPDARARWAALLFALSMLGHTRQSFAHGHGSGHGAAAGSKGAARSKAASPTSTNDVRQLKLVHTRESRLIAVAREARRLMDSGDCAAALDLLDEAIDASGEPILHRDRGLCHDRLDHPYPAIDDFRIYLTAHPDAPDADAIRARLAILEASVAAPESSSSGTAVAVSQPLPVTASPASAAEASSAEAPSPAQASSAAPPPASTTSHH